jgi:hypothetical protein
MPIQGIQQNFGGILQNQAMTGAGGQGRAYQQMADMSRAQGWTPEQLSAASSGIGGGRHYSVDEVNQLLQQYPGQQQPQMPNQPYGLGGAEMAMNQGRDAALAEMARTREQVSGLYGQGRDTLSPYAEAGIPAAQLQAALSGALGPQAQQEAFAQYQQSPGVAFAQEEAERALMRNASALGGLSGGNVMDELSRRAVGTYMQDFDNQFNRIGQVADRGFSGSAGIAGMYAGEAGTQAGLGQYAASMPFAAGQQTANMRQQAGRDISANVGGATSALANLAQNQGAGMADIVGNAANNLDSLFRAAMAGDANANQQLAIALANLNSGAAGQSAGVPIVPGPGSNLLGGLGQVAGGIGGIMMGMNPPTYNVPATTGSTG